MSGLNWAKQPNQPINLQGNVVFVANIQGFRPFCGLSRTIIRLIIIWAEKCQKLQTLLKMLKQSVKNVGWDTNFYPLWRPVIVFIIGAMPRLHWKEMKFEMNFHCRCRYAAPTLVWCPCPELRSPPPIYLPTCIQIHCTGRTDKSYRWCKCNFLFLDFIHKHILLKK